MIEEFETWQDAEAKYGAVENTEVLTPEEIEELLNTAEEAK